MLGIRLRTQRRTARYTEPWHSRSRNVPDEAARYVSNGALLQMGPVRTAARARRALAASYD